MEENYIDKKLKSILQSPPEFPIDEGAIGDMRSRLRVQSQFRQGPKRWWYAAALIPFLLLIGTAFQKYNSLNNEMSVLREQMSKLQAVAQKDTIIEKQIIHHYDTIYSTFIRGATPLITQSSSEQKNFARQLYTSLARLSELTITSTPEIVNWGSDEGMYSLLTKRRSTGSFDRIGLSAGLVTKPYDVWQREVELLALIDPRMLEGPERRTPEWVGNLKKGIDNRNQRINPLFLFTPEGLSLEINGAPILQMVDKGALGRTSAYGVSGIIHFPLGRSLRIGVELLRNRFELKDDDDGDFSGFPIENPADPSDVLHELKGDLNTLQVPVSLRQIFGKHDRWKPFIDLGFVATRPLRQAFTYEYIDDSEEYKLTNVLREGDFSIENMRVGLGTNYIFANRWSVATSLYYQHDFSQDIGEYFKSSQLQWQFGLAYRLTR